jgi:hypothetical protein
MNSQFERRKMTKNFLHIILAAGFLVLAVLACSPPASNEGPSVQITSPVDGSTVTVGVATQIQATATAGAGVTRVDLSVNGRVVDTITPPSGNPTNFPFVQPWTPATAGDVAVMVVAYDTQGAASPPAVVRLVAVDGGGGPAPTSAPQPTDKPVDDVVGEDGCTLNAGYVTDVTIPDNTALGSGDGFVKTWRIRNSGTCDWGSGFKLVFVNGDHMGGSGSVAVSATAAGGTTDVSVNLSAPSSPGTYRGNWRMQADTGIFFGSTFYVQIVVPDSATEVPVVEPTEKPTAEPTDTLLPDLVVVRGTVTPEFVKKDQVVQVEVEIENKGEGPASGTFAVMWVCGSGCQWTVEGLEPGEKVTLQCTAIPLYTSSPVIHNYAIVDMGNSIAESNEDNNILQLPPLSVIK